MPSIQIHPTRSSFESNGATIGDDCAALVGAIGTARDAAEQTLDEPSQNSSSF
jgi:hypothetical protein